MLFFAGERSGELLEDNSSFAGVSMLSGTMGSFPLLRVVGCFAWLLSYASYFSKIAHFFNLGRQTVVFPLLMFSAILQFLHLSYFLFLFLLHVLTLMKKLVFERLDHWVSSHCTYVREIKCGYGNRWSYKWRRATR